MTACSTKQNTDKLPYKTTHIINDSSFYEFKNNSIRLTAYKNNYNDKTILTDILLISLNNKDTLIDYQGLDGCNLEQSQDSIILHFTNYFYDEQHKEWEIREWYSIFIDLIENSSPQFIGKINKQFILSNNDIAEIKVNYRNKLNDQNFKINWLNTELKTSALERIENELFIAALNGDKESIELFKEFPKHFKIDGSYSESYDMKLKDLEFIMKSNNKH